MSKKSGSDTNSFSVEIPEHVYPVINMDRRLKEMKNILRGFVRNDVINRIWHKDYTVWKNEPEEISNRLGWLQVIDIMFDALPGLENFADEVKRAGYHHVVLLGMGGSSLGPEVLRKTFGTSPGFPGLIVLDSTVPSQVEAVTRSIELKHTLFLVSSKSGTTVETISLYKYFRGLVEREVGEDQAGYNFAAITDNNTPLARLAQEKGFRRTFVNPSDIGGRYSVLSYFGLVPAALSGIDIRALLQSATKMQESCAPCVNTFENPGAWLGALIADCAAHGRDKLTFVISPSVSSFGLWVEQLLAESTGKQGRGVIPVIDEPLLYPDSYGRDRVFVYLRMEGDDVTKLDRFVELLEVGGQPVIQLRIKDENDLGALFFRWEFATAVIGAILKINPFDQPDVQATKEAAGRILKELKNKSGVRAEKIDTGLAGWLSKTKPGDYLAIMLYMRQTPAIDRVIAYFRRDVAQSRRITSTLGYGPRFLHSTGQLHKGGPGKAVFLQVTSGRKRDLKIPGENYTLGDLTRAESLGDYLALNSRRRRAFRVQVSSESAKAIESLTQRLMSA